MKNIVIIIILFVFYNGIAQNQVVNTDKIKLIKDYVNHFEKNNQIVGTLSIFEDGRELVNMTFNEQKVDKNSSEEKKYTVGSMTKLFTAVLFAKLKEEGKIDFNERLDNYFPLMPNADKIQIRHMLNHKSGLKDYVTKYDSLHFWLKEPTTKIEIMREILRQDVAFEPGEKVRYSNSAYYLLAQILEKKHNKPYSQIIKDEILKPLDLKNTFAIDKNTDTKFISNSYIRKNEKWEKIKDFYFPNTTGVGNVASTAHDINYFLNVLFTYKLIKKSSLEEMLPKENDWIGLGIMKVPFYDEISFGHGGDTFGTHGVCSYNLTNKLAITYIINGEHFPTNDFAIGIYSILYDKEYKLPEFKEYIPNKNFFDFYVGNYKAQKLPIELKIFKENGLLMAQGKGQPSFPLSAIEKDIFEFKKANVVIEFNTQENFLILKQAGQEFTLKKITSKE